MKYFMLLLLGSFYFLTPAKAVDRSQFDWDGVRLLAIQERGRFKPLQTFAEESLLYITGKRSWNGMGATEVLFSWLIDYENSWANEAFLRIDYAPLKQALGLETHRRYFNPEEIKSNEKLGKLFREALQMEDRRQKLDDLHQKAKSATSQLALLEGIVGGEAFTIFPNPQGADAKWLSLNSLTQKGEPLPYEPQKNRLISDIVAKMLTSYAQGDTQQWNESSRELSKTLAHQLPEVHYPSEKSLKLENHYNNLRPFRWAWVLFSFSFLFLVLSNFNSSVFLRKGGYAFLLTGFFLHTYGFIIRCMISGRPPVTNMYESVIWVAWGTMVFALIVWAIYKNPIILTSATVFTIVCLVLADNVPIILDPSIQPLEPVLRSNLWLTIHVLTITLSYAAFALSLCLGNIVLGNYLFKPDNTEKIQNLNLFMYRAMQIGVVLLTAGTILGGVWADYSWGRFWGWDPKEVWALIALLMYLAVLHGRFAGWLKSFGFAAASVLSFVAVLMAWYGVNFVLGVGLHSYGFGSGGAPFIIIYLVIQIAFVVISYVRYIRSDAAKNSSLFPRQKS